MSPTNTSTSTNSSPTSGPSARDVSHAPILRKSSRVACPPVYQIAKVAPKET